MSSEIKVDTISENTSANGVVIDSVTLKDGGIKATGNVGIGETNPDNSIHITSNTPIIRFDESDVSQSYQIGSFGGIFAVYDNTDSAFRFLLNGDGDLSTGGETAPDVDPGGLTLNHGANDAKVLTFKNSDVSHSMTALGEADTYANFGKNSSATGGLFIQGISESTFPLTIRGAGNSTDTAKSGAAAGFIMLEAAQFNGSTSVASPGSNVNLVTIRSGTDDCVFIFDEEGDFHADSSSTTFDAYEDAQLVRAYDLSHGKGVIDSKFDKFVSYNADKLADLKLIGRNKDGTPNSHVNITGFQRLHNGAIWQQYEKHQRLANAVYELAKAAVGEDKANEILEQNDIKLLN